VSAEGTGKKTPDISSLILSQAASLINGDRRTQYGDPCHNYSRLGRIWGGLLGIPDIPAETVLIMMAAMKLSREAAKHNLDNLIDAAGYVALVGRVKNP
jgi:hypothetical protein